MREGRCCGLSQDIFRSNPPSFTLRGIFFRGKKKVFFIFRPKFSLCFFFEGGGREATRKTSSLHSLAQFILEPLLLLLLLLLLSLVCRVFFSAGWSKEAFLGEGRSREREGEALCEVYQSVSPVICKLERREDSLFSFFCLDVLVQ